MKPLVSAIVPARDEEHNISAIFMKFRPLLGFTEVIFVEGGSSDKTWEVARSYDGKKNKHGVMFIAIKQKEKGKSAAVATGFDRAKGKYLIIVDADMSIRQKDLEKIIALFFENGDKIIGSGNRLKGFRKPKAFYWINYIGNYFFRYYYSIILKTKILDISCGSKAMSKETWVNVRLLRKRYGKLDLWGDIDWLYYGKKTGAKIKFVDVDYAFRRFGKSKLQNVFVRWKFAFKMFVIGFLILKIGRIDEKN